MKKMRNYLLTLSITLIALPVIGQSKLMDGKEMDKVVMQSEKSADNVHESLSRRASTGNWYSLGYATFIDNFLCEREYQVELQQYLGNPSWFRLVQPYHQAFTAESWNSNGTPAEDLQFQVMKKGDMFEVYKDTAWVYEPLVHDSLVWFSKRCTGLYGEWEADSNTVGDNIYITHPGYWARWGKQDSILHNRVLSYQESGYPEVVQLAPRYYVNNLGGWNFSQRDSVVLIKFPTISFSKLEQQVISVTQNSNSGIAYANYTGTLEDGSVLGFYRSGSYTYFCGAISSATSITVPQKINYNGTEYAVKYCGYSSGETLDFDEATNVTSLTLPASITINNYIPSTITDLHLLGMTPPSIGSSYQYLQSVIVWVPQSAYATYQSLTTNSNSGWYGVEVHYEGWEPRSYTVTVNTPGTFGNILLSTIEQWTDVDELTVIGHLNTDDLKLLTRLKQMRKLDLSQTDITVMTGCSGLKHLQEVLLPSTVTEVDGRAFSGCSKLKEINIPNATFIGSDAFSSCSSLTTVSLPAATSIGSYAFSSCSSLSTVSLPAATSIGSYAFRSCSSLSTVSLPVATSIGECAFYYCSSLYKVSLPAATSIGSSAFRSCSSLTTVSLPAATSIGYDAFYYCSSLTTVSLPDCLQSLGSSAFNGCSNLQNVYCRVVAPLTTSAFSGVGSAATLHVPAFSLTSYMLHDSWYSFYQIVALDETLENLTINSNFTITDYTGLAEKVDLALTQNGHLTVSAGSTFNLGTFTQAQATTTDSRISTMVTSNEIKADNVNLKLSVQTNRWNFISFPFDVNVSDIEYPEGTLWVIRKYSGADRAALTGNTWQNMTNGTVLQAGEGYILHCANESTSTVKFVFRAVNNAKKNGLFAYQDVVKPLATYASEHAHNRSWNLVGNPYPAYFDTHSIDHNGVITVYNVNNYYSGGNYTAYSLLDDDYVLRPNEAFFVQCPPDATSMTFKAEGRTHEYNVNGNGTSTRAPRKAAPANSNRKVYNFTLSNSDLSDRARLVINPDAKMDYEISCDASKFMSDDASVPQLYVLDNGIRYAIDERPLGDGIITLGARFGQTGEYTIALKNNPAEDMSILLIDNETGRKVNIAEESYTFNAQAGTFENRFTLVVGSDATGVNEIVNSESSNSKSLYDLQGRRTNSQSQKGIYIIKQNGKSRKVIK